AIATTTATATAASSAPTRSLRCRRTASPSWRSNQTAWTSKSCGGSPGSPGVPTAASWSIRNLSPPCPSTTAPADEPSSRPTRPALTRRGKRDESILRAEGRRNPRPGVHQHRGRHSLVRRPSPVRRRKPVSSGRRRPPVRPIDPSHARYGFRPEPTCCHPLVRPGDPLHGRRLRRGEGRRVSGRPCDRGALGSARRGRLCPAGRRAEALRLYEAAPLAHVHAPGSPLSVPRRARDGGRTMSGDLIPRQPDATPAVYDAATLAVLAAMEEAAEKHLDAI